MNLEEESRKKIRIFIEENMRSLDDDIILKDSDNIFEKGFVSSLMAMQLLIFIEKEFSVSIGDEDLTLTNFSSVDNMMNLVKNIKGDVYA